MSYWFRLFRAIAFSAGVLLLGINVAGLFTSLRSDAIYAPPRQKPVGPVPPASDLFAQIDSYHGDKKSYVQHLTHDVSVGIRHYWDDDVIDQFHLRVPVEENYLLYFASFVRPDRFMKYEFTDYRKAVERGVGLCSQCVVIVAEVLKEKHIHSRIVSFTEHVVVQAEVAPDEWWVLDPDYGVAIPYSVAQIHANPELVRKCYADAGWAPQPIENLMRIYGGDEPMIYSGDGARSYHAKLWIAEKLCYIMIWVIPAILMLPQLLHWLRKARSSGKSGILMRSHGQTAINTRNAI